MGSPLEQTHSDLNSEEKAAHHAPHRCTDVFCLPVLLLGLAGVGLVLHYAQDKADIRRLSHGIDWDGHLCGVDAQVADKPFLYWCAKAGGSFEPEELAKLGFEAMGQDGEKLGLDSLVGSLAVMAATNSLDLGSPICVSDCPNGATTQHACFQDSKISEIENPTTGDLKREVSYDLAFVQDYATSKVAKRYCIPQTTHLLKGLEPVMQIGGQYLLFHAMEVGMAWPVIAIAAVGSIVFGYVHLLLVKKLAAPCVWSGIVLACLLPLVGGAYGLVATFSADVPELLHDRLGANATGANATGANATGANSTAANATGSGLAPVVLMTGNKAVDTVVWSFLLILGVLLIIAACFMRRRIAVVLESIEAAFDCIWDMPGMLLQPLLSAIPRVLYVVCALCGFAWLLTLGQVERYDPSAYLPTGVLRTFVLSPDEQLMVGVYCFMAIWGLELMMAMDHFVFAYATSRWYFMDHDREGRKPVSKFVLIKGYCVALTYHLGSLAVGSFLLSSFRLVQWLMYFVEQRMKEAAGEDSKASAVIDCLAKACCCCLACFEKFIRFLNKEAYLVVALESVGFCEAAERAFNIVWSEAATMGVLQGATQLFQVGGVVSITAAGTGFTWLLCTHTSEFTDPASETYVSAPELVAAVGGFIAMLVSLCFTFMFDAVCDSTLFCWALDRRLQAEGKRGFLQDRHTPPRMQALAGMGRDGDPGRPLLRA